MDLINLDDLFKIFKAAAEQPQQADPSEYLLGNTYEQTYYGYLLGTAFEF